MLDSKFQPCSRVHLTGQGVEAILTIKLSLLHAWICYAMLINTGRGCNVGCDQVVPVALPSDGSYGCCSSGGTLLYEQFKNSTTTCTHSALLHPVRPTTVLAIDSQQQQHWHAD